METIGNVPVTAPLWRGTPAMTLTGIIELLSRASYHYADDSGGEWGRAALAEMEAAAIINDCELSFEAIKLLHGEKPQLITLGDLINAVLKDARS